MSKFEELFGEKIRENTLNSAQNVYVESGDEIEIKRIDRILFIGLLIMIIIVPLIVRVHMADFISPQVTGTEMDTGIKGDIFTFYKFVTLVIGTVILSMIFLYKVFGIGYVLPKSKINILTGLFTVTLILSAVFSPNKTLALVGMYNRHDGTVSYLCYIALFFIATNIKYSTKMIKVILYSLVPFTLINAALGLIGFYEKDVFQWNWINKLVFGELSEGSKVSGGSRLLSTLNNQNYISGFAGTLTVLFFTMAILKKRFIEKVILIILTLVSYLMILTSLSTSGFLALILTLPVIFVLALLSKSKALNLTSFIIGCIGFLLILNILAIKNPKVWNESVGSFVNKNPYVVTQNSFKKFIDSDNEVKAATQKREFNIKILPPPKVSAGSGRIYIWEKSIKMINERPIFGYGLDTFVYQFPQDDPKKISGLGTYNITTDKPHNFFIGLAYGSGVISAIALFLIFSLILVKWIVDLFKKRLREEMVAIGLMLVTFMVQAIFNDSIIGFTNVIFIFFGILAANTVINKNEIVGE